MNEQEYLNQISAEVRPEKAPKVRNGIFASPFFKVGVIGLVALVLIMIAGSVLSSGKTDGKTRTIQLLLHLDNTAEVISDYQPSVKSSDLRSSSASLYSVLTNTSRETTNYLSENYGYKSASNDLVTQADTERDGLEADLFDAKINGTLDRIFAHKMEYEITMILAEEQSVYRVTSDSGYRSALESSMSSLETLYDKFNSFSETK